MHEPKRVTPELFERAQQELSELYRILYEVANYTLPKSTSGLGALYAESKEMAPHHFFASSLVKKTPPGHSPNRCGVGY